METSLTDLGISNDPPPPAPVAPSAPPAAQGGGLMPNPVMTSRSPMAPDNHSWGQHATNLGHALTTASAPPPKWNLANNDTLLLFAIIAVGFSSFTQQKLVTTSAIFQSSLARVLVTSAACTIAYTVASRYV